MTSAPTTVVGDPTDGPESSTGVTSLHDRVQLLTGATSWTLHPLASAGLRPIVFSDGPIGVRGTDDDPTFSAQLPSPSAVAATWDRVLVTRLGVLTAHEAMRKNVDVVLAPVVNLQRTPVGGRHFESFSEDPLLTGTIATTLIVAAQGEGIGMCVKHFIGNESETDRTEYVSRIPERALREVYLAPFELAVKAGVWVVMAAYNQIDNGIMSAPSTEHGSLILDLLKGEWNYDGVVVSDWLAATTTFESAIGGLDLIMPGPQGPWGDALVELVGSGLVPDSVIDDKVARLLRLGQRVGAIGESQRGAVDADLPIAALTRGLLRETVARSTVVLSNDGTLPLQADRLLKVALMGPNLIEPFIQGGGSASVTPPYLSRVDDAIRAAVPEAVVTTHNGVSGRRHAHPVDPAIVFTPSGQPGYEIALFDHAGVPVGVPAVVAGDEAWNRQVPRSARTARVRAVLRLRGEGAHRVEVGTSGAHRIRFDDVEVSASDVIADHDVILDSSVNNPDGPAATFVVEPGSTQRDVAVDAELQVIDAGGYGTLVRFALRHDENVVDDESEIADAVDAARAANVAIVVVGTNEETESEGWDRPNLELPGRQNELVRRVIEANPRTIVVVNAGAPAILPWLDDAAAVLWWWLPGQEAGNGLADAIFGITEPSGHLPWTLPARESDVPVPNGLPVDGVVDYTEGIDVGYRGWDRDHLVPAREFGFGLGYSTWQYESLRSTGGTAHQAVEVVVTNTGARPARETVQLYLEAETVTTDRPVRWLAGFDTVDVGPGETVTLDVPLARRSFEVWDIETQRWNLPPGNYRIRAGRSSRDLRLVASIHFD